MVSEAPEPENTPAVKVLLLGVYLRSPSTIVGLVPLVPVDINKYLILVVLPDPVIETLLAVVAVAALPVQDAEEPVILLVIVPGSLASAMVPEEIFDAFSPVIEPPGPEKPPSQVRISELALYLSPPLLRTDLLPVPSVSTTLYNTLLVVPVTVIVDARVAVEAVVALPLRLPDTALATVKLLRISLFWSAL